MTSYLSDFLVYVGRIREFTRRDWQVYIAWVGMMLGLVASTGGFVIVGHINGVVFHPRHGSCRSAPPFSRSRSRSTRVGHRTIYKEVLKQGEQLVHHVTIFCGIGSCVLLCAAYALPGAMWVPAMVLTVLSFVYSMVDEVFHWRRYITQKSDRIEMWSHLGILIGHGIMMLAWWHWFFGGYKVWSRRSRDAPVAGAHSHACALRGPPARKPRAGRPRGRERRVGEIDISNLLMSKVGLYGRYRDPSARPRYLHAPIESDLAERMVFVGGPRQVGKTTLALQIVGARDTRHPAYLSWDDVRARPRIRAGELPAGEPRVILDEIHKYAKWRTS